MSIGALETLTPVGNRGEMASMINDFDASLLSSFGVQVKTNTHLRGGITAFSRFGLGANVGHRGGRLIWQLANSQGLLICWRPTPGEVPRDVERRLIREFAEHYQKRPFANLTD